MRGATVAYAQEPTAAAAGAAAAGFPGLGGPGPGVGGHVGAQVHGIAGLASGEEGGGPSHVPIAGRLGID